MPHIHIEEGQHDSTVSAFIVHSERKALLLHRHRKLGILLQPGGHIELHENPWQSMAHELIEETGYTLNQLEVLQTAPPIAGLIETVHPLPLAYRSHTFPVAQELHYHTDAAFGLITAEEPLGKPAEGESQELYWLTLEELEKASRNTMPRDTRTIGMHILSNLETYLKVPASSYAH